jgi:hypothetical protein
VIRTPQAAVPTFVQRAKLAESEPALERRGAADRRVESEPWAEAAFEIAAWVLQSG